MNNSNCFNLSVLTWNIYIGADLTPLINVAPAQLPMRVTEVLRQFFATNFPVRVKAIACEIAAKKPDFIALQEAAVCQLTIPNFRIINYDFIKLLIAELAETGLNYKIAAQNRNLSVELPDSNGNLVRFAEQDVILISDKSRINIVGRSQTNYKAGLAVQFAGQLYNIPRGWSYVDVKQGGNVCRLINTHLESYVPAVRKKQAWELLTGPAATRLPLIITGDLNSGASGSEEVYRIFTGAGFTDAWQAVGKGSGYTFGQAPDLLNAVSGLNTRIDFILCKNGWQALAANLTGATPDKRAFNGLWPSDHAGVSARFQLKQP